MRKILFILKYRTCDHYGTHLSSGLLNSANFVNDVLNKTGHVESSLVQVPDGNYVDREVYLKKPDIVVLEAYWVSPAKVLELTKLHPKVKWIVRSHSNLPFFATEANALKWTWEYLTVPNLTIAPNNLKLLDCLIKMTKHSSKIKHLPNYYPTKKDRCFHTRPSRYGVIDVGCFGALRPLKNQVNQAMAAMLYADNHRANLKFHINHSRSDGNGNSILLNLRSMFNPIFNPNHRLVEHDWVSHDDFMKLMTTMDIGMQVSYTETSTSSPPTWWRVEFQSWYPMTSTGYPRNVMPIPIQSEACARPWIMW